jgi:hypothetical protein
MRRGAEAGEAAAREISGEHAEHRWGDRQQQERERHRSLWTTDW